MKAESTRKPGSFGIFSTPMSKRLLVSAITYVSNPLKRTISGIYQASPLASLILEPISKTT
jgi:hypothetical protein